MPRPTRPATTATTWSEVFELHESRIRDDIEDLVDEETLFGELLEQGHLRGPLLGGLGELLARGLVVLGPDACRSATAVYAAHVEGALLELADGTGSADPLVAYNLVSASQVLRSTGWAPAGFRKKGRWQDVISRVPVDPDRLTHRQTASLAAFAAANADLPLCTELARAAHEAARHDPQIAPFNVYGPLVEIANAVHRVAAYEEVADTWTSLFTRFPLFWAGGCLSFSALVGLGIAVDTYLLGHPMAEVAARLHTRARNSS